MSIIKLSRDLITSILLAFTFNSCTNIPKGAIAVKSFDKLKYFGKWYEIARLDFRFEKNMNNTTATYSLNKDGSIKVDNQGYNYKKKKWEHAIGKAKFVDDTAVAMLKVSFFGPFYAGYNVIALDSNYQFALIAGKSLSYLWILSREKSIPDNIKQNYLSIADKLGYKIADLVWVKHNK